MRSWDAPQLRQLVGRTQLKAAAGDQTCFLGAGGRGRFSGSDGFAYVHEGSAVLINLASAGSEGSVVFCSFLPSGNERSDFNSFPAEVGLLGCKGQMLIS